MKNRTRLKLVVSSILAMTTFAPGVTAASPKAKEVSKSSAVMVPTNAPVEIPQSVFVIPSVPKEGRNPFFPESVSKVPVAVAVKNRPMDISDLVLNGITSPPIRTAMINGRTFETGESGEVKIRTGAKLLIKCVEIKSDAAVILVNGELRELRLRFGL